MNVHKFYKIALERMLEVAEYQKAMCGKLENIGKKSQADVDTTKIHSAMTYMDTFTQEYLMVALFSEFPHLVPIVEESTGMKRKYQDNKSDDVLIIDPIDGTSVYQKGQKDYSMMVGLLHKGMMAAALACYPETKEVYAAIRGEGAWHINAEGKRKKLKIAKAADKKSIIAHYRFFIKPFKTLSQRLKQKGYTIGTNIVDYGTNVSGILKIIKGEICAFIGPHITLTDCGVPSLIIEETRGALRMFSYDGQNDPHSWTPTCNKFTGLDPKRPNPRFRIILADNDATIDRIVKDMCES